MKVDTDRLRAFAHNLAGADEIRAAADLIDRLRDEVEYIYPFGLYAQAAGLDKRDDLATPILTHGHSYLCVGAFKSAAEATKGQPDADT